MSATPLNVLAICTAYESGMGHAGRDLCNPYREGSDEWHAYAHGKREGEERVSVSLNAREQYWIRRATFWREKAKALGYDPELEAEFRADLAALAAAGEGKG